VHKLASQNPEGFLANALHALATSPDWRMLLDELPVPIYVTDAQGRLTYSNRPCARFAGREPQPGRDRWCITWHLYTTTGEPIPHEECPMAHAIRERRTIRDQIAIAERPNGSRVAFRPYPTPLFDDDGSLTGAINMLIDVTEEQTKVLDDQASRCRRLAGATYNREISTVLSRMADGYERTAADLRADNDS
jgi:PAS domain S-box-containing protein